MDWHAQKQCSVDTTPASSVERFSEVIERILVTRAKNYKFASYLYTRQLINKA